MYTPEMIENFFKLLETYLNSANAETLQQIRTQLKQNPGFTHITSAQHGLALHYVALNPELLSVFYEHKAPINFQNKDGSTLCHILAVKDLTGVSLKIALTHHENPLQLNADNKTALDLAKECKNPITTQLLDAHIEGPRKRYFFQRIDAYLNARPENAQSIFEELNKFLSEHPRYANSTTATGTPVLHYVAQHHNPALLQLLCCFRADVLAYDEKGDTLCNILALHDTTGDCLKIALVYGANPSQQHRVTKQNAIETAAQNRLMHTATSLRTYIKTNPVPHPQITAHPFISQLEYYFKTKNTHPAQQPSLLHTLANTLGCHPEYANVCNTTGTPVLHLAICENDAPLVALFCQHKAQIGKKDPLGVSALMRAAQRDKQGDCLTELLKHATPQDLEQRTTVVNNPETGRTRGAPTALDFAKQANNSVAIRLLTKQAPSKIRILKGETPPPIFYSTAVSPETSRIDHLTARYLQFIRK